MIQAAPSTLYPRLRRTVKRWVDGWNRIGEQTQFYGKTLRSSGTAISRYNGEVVRLIAQMSLGTGALAVIGGTVVIVAFLTLSAGAVVAIQGYNSLAGIGVEALTGFVSAYVNVRIIAPLVAGIGLAATIGAGATAQLGAMRINEEIDALEVMGIRSIPYLASTRVVAGVIVVIPLVLHRSTDVFLRGTFRHHRRVSPVGGRVRPLLQHVPEPDRSDLVVLSGGRSWPWSSCWCTPITGYTARGGPAGVGEAVGRAVRTSLISAVLVTLFVSLAIYGQSGNFNFSG